MYEAKISAAGLRHLNRLPEKVRQAALEAIFGPIGQVASKISAPDQQVTVSRSTAMPPPQVHFGR